MNVAPVLIFRSPHVCYNADGLEDRTEDAQGTITREVYNGQGEVVSDWVGTNDTPESGYWSPTNAAGMVETESFTYDNGSVGDGNLTQTIQYPDGATGERVTDWYYSWRDQQVAEKDGVSEDEDDGVNRPLTVLSYDNLDEVTETQVYSGDGIIPSIVDGELSLPDDIDSYLQAQTVTSYDSQGQVWQTQVYSVNPTTGDVSSAALTTENYYDPNGNNIATSAPGGLWTKTTYNGAGWEVMQYQTDGGSGTSYADASIVSSDVVLSQTQQLYYNDGDNTETITKERFSTDSTTATGALGTTDSGVEARTYYSGNYYDLADRTIASVDVGTNGGSAWTMPDSPPSRSSDVLETTYGYAADSVQTVTLTGGPTGGSFTLTFDGDTTTTIPYGSSATTVQGDLESLADIGSDNVIVTTGINGGWQVRFTGTLSGTYQNQLTGNGSGLTGGTSPGVSVNTLSLGGDNGNVIDTTDPDDIDTRNYYNPLGQVVQDVQDFTNGAITASSNKTTDYAFNSAGMTSLTAAMLNSDGTITGETTAWIYGVTTGTGSVIDSNDIVGITEQPNPSTGAADSSLASTVTVDALGETSTSTDPNGTKHEYGYNVLGQQTSDYVATFASGVDMTVDKITTSYTALGNVYLVTSYNSSSDVVNQVEMLYNGLDQEIQEFEAVNGAVNVDTTPSVQNTYTNIADGNNSRLTSIIYPDGYTVYDNYSSGLDSDISRLSYLSDDTGTLQSYQYLGLDTIVVMAEPQADLELTYLTTDDSTGVAGDEYTGLDQFGRVVDQNWYNTSTDTSIYNDQYLLNDDGNVRFKVDSIDSSMGEYFTYDGLNQVTGYERGDVVYLGPDYGVSGTPSVTESFTYDSLGNDLVDSTTTTSTTTLTSAFKDPLGFGGGDQDLYGFDDDSPLSHVDPSGLDGVNVWITLSGGIDPSPLTAGAGWWHSFGATVGGIFGSGSLTETDNSLIDAVNKLQKRLSKGDCIKNLEIAGHGAPGQWNIYVGDDKWVNILNGAALEGYITSYINPGKPAWVSGPVKTTIEALDWLRQHMCKDSKIILMLCHQAEGEALGNGAGDTFCGLLAHAFGHPVQAFSGLGIGIGEGTWYQFEWLLMNKVQKTVCPE